MARWSWLKRAWGGGAPAETALWLGLTAAYLVPIWAFAYVPSEDGPSHLANAAIISRYYDPAASTIRAFYLLKTTPVPNVLYHYLVAALMWPLPPLAAEKVALSLYVVLFAVALRRLGAAADGRAGPATLLALPLAYSFTFHMGFFGWQLALAGGTLGAAVFWRSSRGGLAAALLWNAVAVALYFCHLLGFGLFLAAVTLMSWGRGAAAWRRARRAGAVGAPERRRLVAALCWPLSLAPAAALGVWYYLRWPGTIPTTRAPFGELFLRLARMDILYSIFPWQRWLAAGVAAALWGIAAVLVAARLVSWLRRRRRGGAGAWGGHAAFGAVFLITLALYFALPNAGPAGGSYVHPRLATLPVLVVVAWLAAAAGPRLRRILYVVGPAVALVHLGGVTASYRLANADLARFNAARPLMAPGATFLPLVNRWLPGRGANVNYLAHAGGYYTLDGCGVDLLNYEASWNYFPVAWRAGRPLVPVYEGDEGTPVYDLTGKYGRIDYVLGWEINPFTPGMRAILAHYDYVYGEGELIFFRRKAGP